MNQNLKRWYFFNFGNVKEILDLGYISAINMWKVIINGDASFDISNVAFDTEMPLSINFIKVYSVKNGKRKKYQMQPVTVGKNTTVKCNRKVVEKK